MGTVAFDGSQPGTPVGFYNHLVSEDAWSWSDGVYLLHGYAPREVPATTEVLMRRKHPMTVQGRWGARSSSPGRETVQLLPPDRRPARTRPVGSECVGRGIENAAGPGRVERVEGYFVDLTDARRDERETEVRRALTGIAAHRETIDLAKGMVMAALSCDGQAAFECLRRYSQNANIKLHDVAQRLVGATAPAGQETAWVIRFLDSLATPTRTSGGTPSREQPSEQRCCTPRI